MNSSPLTKATDSSDSVCHLDAEMAELTLLLPTWWLAALESAAAEQDKTAAQLVRNLIREYLMR